MAGRCARAGAGEAPPAAVRRSAGLPSLGSLRCSLPSPRRPAPAGLRSLSRAQLDSFLTLAQCCIVAQTTGGAHFDAYVLSESSLFVYPSRLLIKTCGTTALLASLPLLLDHARSVGATLSSARYSRSCFRYAAAQPAPHRSWAEEVSFLDAALGCTKPEEKGKACVLGGEGQGLRWHVYSNELPTLSPATPLCRAPPPLLLIKEASMDSSEEEADESAAPPTLTLEICMTQLCPTATAGFTFNLPESDLPPAAAVSLSTGITSLFPSATHIDDFVFSPCGYSMNGLLDQGLSTIHVTPEERCSYASLEVSGHDAATFDPQALLRAALRVFRPGRVSVALTVDRRRAAGARRADVPGEWAAAPLAEGYTSLTSSRTELAGGGYVVFTQQSRVDPRRLSLSREECVASAPAAVFAAAPGRERVEICA